MVVIPNVSQEKVEIKEVSEAFEAEGKLKKQSEENKLMNSVLENDKDTISEGKLIKEALNQGIGGFSPDLLFEQLVKNYSVATKIYGPSLLRLLTNYNSNYLKRNISVPEFRKDLRKNIDDKIESLKEEGLISKDGTIKQKGIRLASLILYTEELDNIIPKGFMGDKIQKKDNRYGDRDEIKPYRRDDRYRDIAIKKSLKLAVRRGHATLGIGDLKTFTRQKKGQIDLIYALDASASMKGRKIERCKKAGIALAFKAIEAKDKVGLLVFGSDVRSAIEPTDDFPRLLMEITQVSARTQTNIATTLQKSISLFPNTESTKHLLLITDALPTEGDDPMQETLDAVSDAVNHGITISMVGVGLDEAGKVLAKQITELGNGRLFVLKDVEDLDLVVLEDYHAL
ncbi:MAG: VWA domain-containing protein [Nanoarchaeota archaeon]|nr:VWA domain-containing protein [Nanoarchaeota archaeon]